MTPSVYGETESIPASTGTRAVPLGKVREGLLQRIPPFRSLDALRGFAAIWVVMCHSCDRFLGGVEPKYFNQPLYFFSIRGGLGVVLFFVISGYCITAAAHGALYSGKTLLRYSYERCRRIFPPYWAIVVLGLLVQFVVIAAESRHWIPKINHPQPLEATPLYWIANFTLTQYELNTGFANIVFWSLGYEIAFYVVVGLCLFAAQRVAKARGMATGQLTLILALAMVTAASLLSLILFNQVFFPFELWPQFAMGGLLFYVLESRKETVAGYSPRLRQILNTIAAVTVVLVILFIFIRPGTTTDPGHPSSAIRTSLCLLFCLFLAVIRRYDSGIAGSPWLRPLLWLGACSYSLYLIHPIVLPFLDVACRRVGLDGSRYWIAFWIQVFLAAGLGRLFYLLVERRFISSRQTSRLKEEHAA